MIESLKPADEWTNKLTYGKLVAYIKQEEGQTYPRCNPWNKAIRFDLRLAEALDYGQVVVLFKQWSTQQVLQNTELPEIKIYGKEDRGINFARICSVFKNTSIAFRCA